MHSQHLPQQSAPQNWRAKDARVGQHAWDPNWDICWPAKAGRRGAGRRGLEAVRKMQ